ncbi:MAG: hypothetical protein CMM58_10905 [Rhodospirillaceae bacterium]|nr:hypothetical protein [Rhodospirillaceae bacterium]|tara:strand:+ start:466 stop:1362 length:897 start_codon:yes stop_codon:yes gene_type:complete
MNEGTYFVELESQGVLEITGSDNVNFLQGLVSNDVETVRQDRAVYSAFLTPQGKFLYDFIISTDDGKRLFLECDRTGLTEFKAKLDIYKLRSQVELRDRSNEFRVYAVYGQNALNFFDLPEIPGAVETFQNGQAMVDPRLHELGARIRLPASTPLDGLELARGSMSAYDELRISMGVPDGVHDMQREKTILLEAGFDELNGISWDKGCYMGQELTARTKYRGLIKRRLIPCKFTGPAPSPGMQITFRDKEAGQVRSVAGRHVLALLRLNIIENVAKDNAALSAGKSSMIPMKPKWGNF